MTANGGTVEYFDTFNDDRRRRRRRRRKHRRHQRSGKSCKNHNATVKDEISEILASGTGLLSLLSDPDPLLPSHRKSGL
jgi:hypothetical protein